MGDGAQVAVQVLLRHADAVVGHGDGAGVLVEGDVDAELVLRQLDAGVGEAFEVQLVDGVRRVGDELAQEDLAVGVDGVDHQVEQLLALCLELAHVRRFLSVRASVLRDLSRGTRGALRSPAAMSVCDARPQAERQAVHTPGE